eukprot:6182518-Pleurochrysis_carterae.AAC.1
MKHACDYIYCLVPRNCAMHSRSDSCIIIGFTFAHAFDTTMSAHRSIEICTSVQKNLHISEVHKLLRSRAGQSVRFMNMAQADRRKCVATCGDGKPKAG